jgi:hypothetical protein
MSSIEPDLGYLSWMPLDTMATTKMHQLPKGYSEINFVIYMVDILKELESSLKATSEQQILKANKYRELYTFEQSDKVFLSTKNLPLTYTNSKRMISAQGYRKSLQHKYIDNFDLRKRYGKNFFEVRLLGH